MQIKHFLFYRIYRKVQIFQKQSKINKAKKSKKTWTPAHQKSQNDRKKPSAMKASKNTPGHKREKHRIENKQKTHQTLYYLYVEITLHEY